MSEEHKRKISYTLTGGKSFTAISPLGEIFEFTNLSDFCKNHNLHPSHLQEVIKDKRLHHKGWTRV